MHRSQQPGYWTLGRHPQYGDIDVHILTPLGPLLLSQFSWLPGFWVGILLLVMLHEVGHAMLARRYGMRVTAIRLHGFGGHCAYMGSPSPWQRSIISWGGVMMQGFLLLAALTWYFTLGPPRTEFLYNLQDAWLYSNVLLIALNLLPFDPFDGGQAWKILPMLRKRWQDRGRRAHLRVLQSPKDGGGDGKGKGKGTGKGNGKGTGKGTASARTLENDPTPPPSKPITPEEYAKAEAQRLWQEALRQRNKPTDKRSMH